MQVAIVFETRELVVEAEIKTCQRCLTETRGYLQSMAAQGYNPLAAIEIALNGNAASMVEKPTQNNPANQDQKQGGE